jgi:hypothetical protein
MWRGAKNFGFTASWANCSSSNMTLMVVMTIDPWFVQVPTSISNRLNTPHPRCAQTVPTWREPWCLWRFWRHSLANLICRVVPSRFFAQPLSLLQLGNDRMHCYKNNHHGDPKCGSMASSRFNQELLYEISGSDDGEYENDCLLGCWTV